MRKDVLLYLLGICLFVLNLLALAAHGQFRELDALSFFAGATAVYMLLVLLFHIRIPE